MIQYSSAADLPSGDAIGYHIAPVEAVTAIQREGIRPDIDADEPWRTVNEWLQRYASECPRVPALPVNRNACVYLFDNPSTPTSWVETDGDHVVFAVDRSTTDNQYYCGEMGLVTSIVQDVASDDALPRRAVEQARADEVEEGSEEAAFLRLTRMYTESVAALPSAGAPVPLDAYNVEVFTPSRIPPSGIQGVWSPTQLSPKQV